MAGQNITFDFLTRGADKTASDFKRTGDNAVLASRGAKVLADAIDKLGSKEDRTAAESKILASALKQTGDAEDRVTAKTVLADAAIGRLGEQMKAAEKNSSSLGKTLGGLKLNPGVLGPALLLAPAVADLARVAAGAAVGLGGAFVAGGAALAAFGAVAKPVLTDALKASKAVNTAQQAYQATLAGRVPVAQAQARLQAANASAQLTYTAALKGGTKPATALAALHLSLAKNQLAYNTATNAGTFAGKAYAAEQKAISKAYAGMSPQQIALSQQLGMMADAWDKLKAAETPVIAGALQPWLKSVTDLTKNLAPIIAAVSPVIGSLGAQFDAIITSTSFTAFRDFIANTGSRAVGAAGNALLGFIDAFITILPKFNPLIQQAIGWLGNLGPSVEKWASSKKTADDITAFMGWFTRNGPQVGTLLTNLGGALKALAPGLTVGGALEIKVISDFLGWIAKLPPSFAKPLAEVAGALLILGKTGVLKVGIQIVGAAAKWLTGGVISIGGDAAAAAMRAAFATGGTAAAAEMRAALAGGGAASGAEGAAGGAAGGAAKGAAGGGLAAGLGAPAGIALAGAIAGAAIRALGDALSPAGSFAGKLNNMFQQLQISSLHSFTFGGLEGWLTSHLGQPVGKVENNLLSGAAIFGKNIGSTVTGSFSNIAGGAKTWWGNITGTVSGAWKSITGSSATGGAAVVRSFGAAGRGADAFRTSNLVPLLGEVGRVSGGVQGLQGFIDRLHGKTVNVGVTASGGGGIKITGTGTASGAGGIRLTNFAEGGKVTGGTPGRDSVLINAMPGELVVPTHMVRGGAVDHLRGMLPGFAAGGLVGLGNSVGRLEPFATGQEQSDTAKSLRALMAEAIAKAKAEVAASFGSGQAIANYAMGFLGRIPYVWGGTAVPGGADCSGFTQAIYGHFGIHAPRTSEAQGAWVKRGSPTPGGLAFYHSPAGGPDPGHVAIVRSGSQVISQGGGLGPQLIGINALPLLWTGVPPGGLPSGGGGGSTAGRMSAAAIAGLWTSLGGPSFAAANMAAIANAESSDIPSAVQTGEPPGLTGWGLYQITPTSGISQNGAYGNLLNASNNTRAAISLFSQSGYGPWASDPVGRGLAAAPFGFGKGGLVPGFAAGGTVGQQGSAWLNAWRNRRGGGFGAAWGPVVVNQQIAEMTAAVRRAKTLAGAHGLSASQHKFWTGTAADEAKRLGVLGKELTTERAWRAALGGSDATLAREIAAAGNTKSLAGPVKGWKAQMSRQKATIAEISRMLGYSDAQRAAIEKAHPPPPPTGVLATHTYGGDVANNIGAFLASAASPFGAARGGMVFDSGGWLKPGWNPPVFNNTGRPEHLVPARGGGGKLQVEWVGGSGGDDLERWIRKNVRIRGGGDVQKAYGAH